MESVLKFIIGVLLIILSFVWFNHEKKNLIKEKKKEDYMSMSFTFEFITGAILLLMIGIKFIYDAFWTKCYVTKLELIMFDIGSTK